LVLLLAELPSYASGIMRVEQVATTLVPILASLLQAQPSALRSRSDLMHTVRQSWAFWRGCKANSAESEISWQDFRCPGAAREVLADLLLGSLALYALKPPPSPLFFWFLQKKTR